MGGCKCASIAVSLLLTVGFLAGCNSLIEFSDEDLSRLSQDDLIKFVVEGSEFNRALVPYVSGKATRKKTYEHAGSFTYAYDWARTHDRLLCVTTTLEGVRSDGSRLSGTDLESESGKYVVTPEVSAEVPNPSAHFAHLKDDNGLLDMRGQYVFDPFDYALGEWGKSLRSLIAIGRIITVKPAMLNGRSLLVVVKRSSRESESCSRYWVDPNKGFCIVRKEYMTPKYDYLAEREVQQLATGAWFPARGHARQMHLRDGKEWVQQFCETWEISDCYIDDDSAHNRIEIADILKPGRRVRDQRFRPPLPFSYTFGLPINPEAIIGPLLQRLSDTDAIPPSGGNFPRSFLRADSSRISCVAEPEKAAKALLDYLESARVQFEALERRNEQHGKTLTDIKPGIWQNTEGVPLRPRKGNILWFHFWSINCPPCVAGLSRVQEAYEKLRDNRVQLVGIHPPSDNAKLVKDILDNAGASFPNIIDMSTDESLAGYWNSKIFEDFGVDWIPRDVLVDGDGKTWYVDSSVENTIQSLREHEQPVPPSESVLKLHAELHIIPDDIDLGYVATNSEVTSSFFVFRSVDPELRMAVAESTEPDVAVVLNRFERGKNAVTVGRVTASVPELIGPFVKRLPLILQTSGGEKNIEIRLHGQAQAPVEVWPKRLFFGMVQAKRGARSKVKLCARNGERFVVRNVRCDVAGIRWKLGGKQDKLEESTDIVFWCQPEKVGFVSGKVQIEVTINEEPSIFELPVAWCGI